MLPNNDYDFKYANKIQTIEFKNGEIKTVSIRHFNLENKKLVCLKGDATTGISKVNPNDTETINDIIEDLNNHYELDLTEISYISGNKVTF